MSSNNMDDFVPKIDFSDIFDDLEQHPNLEHPDSEHNALFGDIVPTFEDSWEDQDNTQQESEHLEHEDTDSSVNLNISGYEDSDGCQSELNGAHVHNEHIAQEPRSPSMNSLAVKDAPMPRPQLNNYPQGRTRIILASEPVGNAHQDYYSDNFAMANLNQNHYHDGYSEDSSNNVLSGKRSPLQPKRGFPVQTRSLRYSPYSKPRPLRLRPLSQNQNKNDQDEMRAPEITQMQITHPNFNQNNRLRPLVDKNKDEKRSLYKDLSNLQSPYFLNNDPNQGLNTKLLAEHISETLRQLYISQTVLGELLLNRKQGTMSQILSHPKEWSQLGVGKEVYLRLHYWILRPEEDKVVLSEVKSGEFCSKKYCAMIGISEPRSKNEKEPMPREKRRFFTTEQKSYLTNIFLENRHPDDLEMMEAAEELELPLKKIKKFFANSRSRNPIKKSQESL